jgi:hypothetical protein
MSELLGQGHRVEGGADAAEGVHGPLNDAAGGAAAPACDAQVTGTEGAAAPTQKPRLRRIGSRKAPQIEPPDLVATVLRDREVLLDCITDWALINSDESLALTLLFLADDDEQPEARAAEHTAVCWNQAGKRLLEAAREEIARPEWCASWAAQTRRLVVDTLALAVACFERCREAAERWQQGGEA